MAEHEARKAMGVRPAPPATPPVEEEGWVCPFCSTVAPLGARVCLGCRAEIVYGLTKEERVESAQLGFIAGGVLVAALMFLAPSWLNGILGSSLSAGWDLGIYSVLPVAPTGVLATLAIAKHREKLRLAEPPRFFRSFMN